MYIDKRYGLDGGVYPSQERLLFLKFEFSHVGDVTAVFVIDNRYMETHLEARERMTARTLMTAIKKLERNGHPTKWLEDILEEMVLYRLSAG